MTEVSWQDVALGVAFLVYCYAALRLYCKP